MINTSVGDRSLRSFIDTEHGTLSRELYVNPDVFQQELEQIFARCWLFLGHESQVPNPGDFFVSRMGTEEVVVVRDRKDHQIRVFLNSCRHRGRKSAGMTRVTPWCSPVPSMPGPTTPPGSW